MLGRKSAVYYPILINLQKYSCLVIGGGKVAFRKVESLLEFKAKITVLSPTFCQPLLKLSEEKKINTIRKEYKKEFLTNFKIVFCTTNDAKVNQQVYNDCKSENILLNIADKPEYCDFILPAILKRGDLSISVSSQGKAPFLVKDIKRKMELLISPAYKEIIRLASSLRKNLMNGHSSVNKRKAFEKFLKTDWEKILTEDGKLKAKAKVDNILKELK